MAKYSIVIPTYNMSHYLNCCIDSLRKQTFCDFEAILVDDCSTDDSFAICSKTAEEDTRFKVVRQVCNGGLSSTRNLGMKNATGRYLLFVDPDDYIEPGLLAMVEKTLRTEKVDMVTWGMYGNIVYPDGHEEIKEMSINSLEDITVLNPRKADWELFTQRLFFASTCNKVYQMKLIRGNSLSFDTECVDFEDFIFNASYMAHIKSFSVKKEPFYHYRQKKGQIATVKRAWNKVKPFHVSNKVYGACERLYECLKENGCNYDDLMLYAFKSFMSEVEYIFRTKSFGEFVAIVKALTQNNSYCEMLSYLNQPALRKLIILLRFFSKMHLGKTQAWVLWLLNRRNLGKSL